MLSSSAKTQSSTGTSALQSSSSLAALPGPEELQFLLPTPFLPAEVSGTCSKPWAWERVFLHSPVLSPNSWSQLCSRLSRQVCFWIFFHCFFPVCLYFLPLHLSLGFDHSSMVSLSFLSFSPCFLDPFPISNPPFCFSGPVAAVPRFHLLLLVPALHRYPLLRHSSPITLAIPSFPWPFPIYFSCYSLSAFLCSISPLYFCCLRDSHYFFSFSVQAGTSIRGIRERGERGLCLQCVSSAWLTVTHRLSSRSLCSVFSTKNKWGAGPRL